MLLLMYIVYACGLCNVSFDNCCEGEARAGGNRSAVEKVSCIGMSSEDSVDEERTHQVRGASA